MLSERFGSKRVWMVSVAVFAISSRCGGIAWSAESLILFRVLQGFGGGLIMPVWHERSGADRGTPPHGPGDVGDRMPMLLGPVLGPVLGGLIVTNTAWEMDLLRQRADRRRCHCSSPPGCSIPSRPCGRRKARLDRPLPLLSPGLASVVFGLAETETSGGLSATIAWGPIAGGIALIALFVRHALRARRPLIDMHLFHSAGFSAAAASVFLLGAALFGAMLLLPLYYQVDRGETALSAGLLMAPQGIGAALVMPISGRLTDRIGGGRVALFGITVMTLATFPLVGVGPTSSYTWLAVVLLVRASAWVAR